LEILIFVVIVALAGGYLARTIWKSLRNQTPSCGGCNACSAALRPGDREGQDRAAGASCGSTSLDNQGEEDDLHRPSRRGREI